MPQFTINTFSGKIELLVMLFILALSVKFELALYPENANKRVMLTEMLTTGQRKFHNVLALLRLTTKYTSS